MAVWAVLTQHLFCHKITSSNITSFPAALHDHWSFIWNGKSVMPFFLHTTDIHSNGAITNLFQASPQTSQCTLQKTGAACAGIIAVISLIRRQKWRKHFVLASVIRDGGNRSCCVGGKEASILDAKNRCTTYEPTRFCSGSESVRWSSGKTNIIPGIIRDTLETNEQICGGNRKLWKFYDHARIP